MQIYYPPISNLLLVVGVVFTIIEASVLYVTASRAQDDEATWLDRTNKTILVSDLFAGAAVLMFYYIIITLGQLIVGLLIFLLGGFLFLSHLWRIHQYLFREGNLFLRSSTLVVMNVIKLILFGGAFFISPAYRYLAF